MFLPKSVITLSSARFLAVSTPWVSLVHLLQQLLLRISLRVSCHEETTCKYRAKGIERYEIWPAPGMIGSNIEANSNQSYIFAANVSAVLTTNTMVDTRPNNLATPPNSLFSSVRHWVAISAATCPRNIYGNAGLPSSPKTLLY